MAYRLQRLTVAAVGDQGIDLTIQFAHFIALRRQNIRQAIQRLGQRVVPGLIFQVLARIPLRGLQRFGKNLQGDSVAAVCQPGHLPLRLRVLL